jgi:DNA-directed RNA polymerase specialized sigma24 family protein
MLFLAEPMPSTPQAPAAQAFPLTRWSLVQRAQKGTEADAMKALEDICRLYWYPIYAYARRSSLNPHDAEDLTQVFFQQMICRETLQAVQQEKGRLRSFMLQLLKQVISRQIRHTHALKRGEGHTPLSLDELHAEERFAQSLAEGDDPATHFDHAWAHEVLTSAEALLKAEYAEAENSTTFDALREFLPLGENATPYGTLSKKLRIREATLRLQIHRMRKRYAKLIEKVIAETVHDATEAKAELEHLMKLVGRHGS